MSSWGKIGILWTKTKCCNVIEKIVVIFPKQHASTLAMGQSKFSYELTLLFIIVKSSGKQKSKNTLRAEINQFCDGKRDTMRSSCHRQNGRG